MLNKTEIISEIRKLMSFNKEEVETFTEAKSGENILRVDSEFVEGAEVFVVTEEGLIPAPDGEHLLDDGRTIIVSGGSITEVVAAEEMKEDDEEEEMKKDDDEEEKKMEEEDVNVEDEDFGYRIKKMEETILDMQEVITELLSAYKNVNNFSKEVEVKIDEFIKNTPAEQHFEELKSEYKSPKSENKENNPLDRIRDIRKK
jgi:hypothetical protein